MQIILLLGNYMNAFGPNGTYVQGFRIDFLTKLSTTRTADNRMSLLQYIAAFLQKKAADVLEFNQTIKTVERASKSMMIGSSTWHTSWLHGRDVHLALCHTDECRMIRVIASIFMWSFPRTQSRSTRF